MRDPADSLIERAARFLRTSRTARALPVKAKRQLEEMLTLDWDGRGLTGEHAETIRMLAGNFHLNSTVPQGRDSL